MSLKNILLVLLSLTSSALYSEKYGSYDISFTHPVSAGMASLGIGFNNPSSSLYNNPAFLSSSSKYVVDGGIGVSANQKKFSPGMPTSFGFYIPSTENFGWGLNGKQVFYQNFPGGYDRMSAYTFSLFGSYKISENWNISLGVGPSVVFRAGYQSNYSIGATVSVSYQNKNHTLGISGQTIGKFRLEGYRDVDALKERLPEIAGLGYGYNWGQTLFYLEGRKIFWEKSTFDLNNENSKPNLDRGLGAEIKLSSGIQYSIKESRMQLRTGVETGGFYDEKGLNRRAGGIAIGASWNYKSADEDEMISIHLALLNYSIFSNKGGRLPESLLFLSVSYIF
ncbi:MAG: hypothetical protein KBA66_17490 [Leptospiraceae bacterium]|nr:hypothetical protein [Leptospiraceae bacterium]